MSEFALESDAFENTQAIPSRHNCEGEDVSPPLRWTNVPERTRSRRSWSMTQTLRAASSRTGSLGGLTPRPRASARASRRRARGRTTSARRATAVPARLRATVAIATSFRLYALDAELELPADVAKAELEQAIEGHVLTTAELVGTSERA
jgi:hypothetical protein